MAGVDLIIDGYNIAYITLFSKIKKQPKFFEFENSPTEFLKDMLDSIDYNVRKVGVQLQSVNIVFDDTSWRYHLPKEDLNRNWSYKDRDRESKIDMEKAGEYIDRFHRLCEKMNFYTFRSKEVEGDDWIYFISKEKARHGNSVVIISGDKDIQSILYTDDEKAIVQFSPNSQRFYYADYEPTSTTSEDDGDIVTDMDAYMDGVTSNSGLSPSMIIKNRVIEEGVPVDTVGQTFVKMVSGDTSDTIPSACYKKNSSGKLIGIGPTGALNIYNEEYKGKLKLKDLLDDEKLMDIAKTLVRHKKIEDVNQIKIVKENLKINLRATMLHWKMLPDHVKRSISVGFSEVLNSAEMKFKHLKLYSRDGEFDLHSHVKGTDYDYKVKSYY